MLGDLGTHDRARDRAREDAADTAGVRVRALTPQIDQDTIKIIQSEGGGSRPKASATATTTQTCSDELLRSRRWPSAPRPRHECGTAAAARSRRTHRDSRRACSATMPRSHRRRTRRPARRRHRCASVTYVQRHLSIDPVREPAWSAASSSTASIRVFREHGQRDRRWRLIATHIDRRFDAPASRCQELPRGPPAVAGSPNRKIPKSNSSSLRSSRASSTSTSSSRPRRRNCRASTRASSPRSSSASRPKPVPPQPEHRRATHCRQVLLSSTSLGQLKNKRTELMSEYQEKLRIFAGLSGNGTDQEPDRRDRPPARRRSRPHQEFDPLRVRCSAQRREHARPAPDRTQGGSCSTCRAAASSTTSSSARSIRIASSTRPAAALQGNRRRGRHHREQHLRRRPRARRSRASART